jgi:hypothetical protein
MAEVIKSIEREALREAQSQEISGRNGKRIDCSTLGDKPLKFSCKNCYTIFEANNREYEYCGDQREGDNWKCECPLCHKMVYYS